MSYHQSASQDIDDSCVYPLHMLILPRERLQKMYIGDCSGEDFESYLEAKAGVFHLMPSKKVCFRSSHQ